MAQTYNDASVSVLHQTFARRNTLAVLCSRCERYLRFFWVLVVARLLGYTHSSQMQTFPSRSKNPQTAGRTWLAPRTMLSDIHAVADKSVISPASLHHQVWRGSPLGARLVIAMLGSTHLSLPLSRQPLRAYPKQFGRLAFPFADRLRT